LTLNIGAAYTPSSMRVLAVDLGSKRIGIAVSDELGISVRPVETIHRKSLARDVDRIRFLAADLQVEAIVVGLPLRMDGSSGEAAAKTLRFVESLKSAVAVSVSTQDERLTSYEADQIMIEQGLSRDQRRARSDEAAAMIILRDFLSTVATKN
jgi:putative pre-16S rRNA nuclease